MTENTISKLPKVLKKYLCTMTRASKDTTKDEAMCESNITVINFDKIPNEYTRGKGWRGVPKSNDALYIDDDNKWFFVEFKNGTIHKEDIYRKIYDSLIMLIELKIIPDFEFARQNITYILVYNEGKHSKIQQSQGRNQNMNYLLRLSGKENRMFDIYKLEDYLLKETHTYTKDLFNTNFIIPKEKEET